MAEKDIIFVKGIVKSREKYLLGEQKFSAMTDAASAEDALKIARENGFGGDAGENFDVNSFEQLVSAEWDSFAQFLREYTPEKFRRSLLAKNDFHNAECAVRLRHTGGTEDIFLPDGEVSRQALLKAADGDFSVIPQYLAEPIKQAEALFEDGDATGVSVGVVFARAYYSFMLKSVKGKLWRENVVYEIDAKNVSVALRSGDKELARTMYIAGGKLPEKTLDLIAEGSPKALGNCARTPYYELVKLGMEERAAGRSLVKFERAAEDFPMKKLKEKRFETEGTFPLLLYAYYKMSEIKNVRIILALKLCGADKEEIRERLRECYAG